MRRVIAKESFVTQKHLKLISWNVNGIRALEKKGFSTWLQGSGADIVMLQETKCSPEQLTEALCKPDGYHSEWCAAEKKGYSGVATFSRIPMTTSRGLGVTRFDSEGRVLITTISLGAQSVNPPDTMPSDSAPPSGTSENNLRSPSFLTLFNIYFPSGSSGMERVAFKLEFYRRFLEVVREYIARGARVIVAGDVNTAYAEIDLARPRENRNSSGFLPEERAALGQFFDAGLVDTFRHVRPAEAKYSWWSQVTNARARNIGWRLDYFFVSQNLLARVVDADIHPEVPGSDHCPVSLTLALE
jgi:exodeoxyribonuclease III